MPDLRDGTPLVYVGGVSGATWHIAAHEPRGYGVRALCGRGWDEGDYLVAGPDDGDPDTLKVCRFCNKTTARLGRPRV